MTTFTKLKQLARSLPIGRIMQRNRAADRPEWVRLANGANGTVDADAGRVWVQRSAGGDADAVARSGELTAVYTGGLNFFPHAGSRVAIAMRDGILKIVDIDDRDNVASEFEPKALNTARPENQWLLLENVTRGKIFPVSDAPSLLLGMRGLVYIDADGTLRVKQLDRQVSKPSLASYIPSAGNHRYVIVFIRAYDNSLQIFGSVEQSLATPLAFADLQECIDGSIVNEDMPNVVLTLADAQTSTNMTNVTDDYRQWLNTPQLPGMMNPVTRNWHIRSTRHELVADRLDVTARLTVAGRLTVVDTKTAYAVAGKLTVRTITSVDSPYTLEASVAVVRADTTNGAITVNLPALADGSRSVHVKNIGANILTIDANGAETIDGDTTLIVPTLYDAPYLVASGDEWSLI